MHTIRLAGLADFDAIAELTARVYIDEGFSPESAESILRDVAARATGTTLLVAIDDASGAVCGAVSLVPPGSSIRQIGRDDELEVRLLAVNPALRGHGTGETLVRACIETAANEGMAVVLSTQPTMEAAQRLYARLGFERIPERDWQRASGRPMLVYRRSFGQRFACIGATHVCNNAH